MKKIPLIVSALLIVGVLATSAFTRPLAVRNGVVTDYSAGSSITIRSGGSEQTYAIRGTAANVMPSDMSNGLGAGARVTVFAQCFAASPRSSSQASSQQATTGNASNQNADSSGDRFSEANSNNCVALAIVVRQAGTTSSSTSSSTSTGSTGTGATGTGTPAVTETPGTTGSPTPMVTVTPTP